MAKWIQHAIKHPGALHKELGVPQGETIPKSKLAAAAKKGGTIGKRARLAETLSHMHHNPKHHSHSTHATGALHARIRAGLKKAFPGTEE